MMTKMVIYGGAAAVHLGSGTEEEICEGVLIDRSLVNAGKNAAMLSMTILAMETEGLYCALTISGIHLPHYAVWLCILPLYASSKQNQILVLLFGPKQHHRHCSALLISHPHSIATSLRIPGSLEKKFSSTAPSEIFALHYSAAFD